MNTYQLDSITTAQYKALPSVEVAIFDLTIIHSLIKKAIKYNKLVKDNNIVIRNPNNKFLYFNKPIFTPTSPWVPLNAISTNGDINPFWLNYYEEPVEQEFVRPKSNYTKIEEFAKAFIKQDNEFLF